MCSSDLDVTNGIVSSSLFLKPKRFGFAYVFILVQDLLIVKILQNECKYIFIKAANNVKKHFRRSDEMKNRAKKRWFALIILLLCAVVIGLFYWNGQKKMQNDEGYLVKYSLPNKKLEVIVHGI